MHSLGLCSLLPFFKVLIAVPLIFQILFSTKTYFSLFLDQIQLAGQWSPVALSGNDNDSGPMFIHPTSASQAAAGSAVASTWAPAD
jgi:hypothetical protein